MKPTKVFRALVSLAILWVSNLSAESPAWADAPAGPVADSISAKAAASAPAIDVAAIDRRRIMKAASAALGMEPVTITKFRAKLSEGGPNDFYSNGDYWWPDPAKADGLPYVQRDGESNPGNFVEHRLAVRELRDAAAALGAAYKISGEDRYAAKAAELLRVFFLDPNTSMNPNLKYAQAIPGRTPGRGTGIIDGLHLAEIPIAVEAMHASPSFPPGTLAGLKQWFRDMAEWMTTSKNGREEAAAKNNHSVAYYLQVAVYARFIGDEAKLAECRRQYKEVFVAGQMASDGSFPAELRRTKPYSYSIFQLDNMAALCQVLSCKEDDLWTFELSDGRCMRRAMEYLYPYLADKSKWPLKPDVQAWEGWPARQPSLLFAGLAFQEPKYLNLWKGLPPDPNDNEVRRNIAITQPVLWLAPAKLLAANAYSTELPTAAATKAVPRKGTSPGSPEAHLDYTPGKAPKYWSIAAAETIMARYPDYREAYWKPWSYVQGYVFYGFEMLYRSTGDKKYLEYIKRYIDNFVDDKGEFHGDKLTNLDNLMTGNSIIALYEYTHDERYKTAAVQFRRALDDYPRSDGQFWHGRSAPNMWIDGVFMGQMFLIRYGKSIGDSEYCFDEAAKQIAVCDKHLSKGDSGLYLHAWTEKPENARWADPKTGLSPEVWSEGLGWYALVAAETLAVIPKDHAKRPELEDIFRRLVVGLKRTQDPKTGGWFMIVDKGDQPDNWIDPSGTAMFVYAIQRGIDLGLLEKDEYATIAAKGYKALLEFAEIN
ncbi:MAG: alginate lyase family protein [Thermoguttaceae bacterium]